MWHLNFIIPIAVASAAFVGLMTLAAILPIILGAIAIIGITLFIVNLMQESSLRSPRIAQAWSLNNASDTEAGNERNNSAETAICENFTENTHEGSMGEQKAQPCATNPID